MTQLYGSKPKLSGSQLLNALEALLFFKERNVFLPDDVKKDWPDSLIQM
jgi:hypothetical protein